MAEKAEGQAAPPTVKDLVAAAQAATELLAAAPLAARYAEIEAAMEEIAAPVRRLEFLIDGLPSASPVRAHIAAVCVSLAHARNNLAAEQAAAAKLKA